MINMKEKSINIIVITICILVGVFIIFCVFVGTKDLKDTYKNCYYELKDGVTCKYQIIYTYETRFNHCSDGYVHIGEPYKEVCKTE